MTEWKIPKEKFTHVLKKWEEKVEVETRKSRNEWKSCYPTLASGEERDAELR